MRNRVAHTYHDVDPAIVDSTVEVDLPNLVEQVDRMLDELGSEARGVVSLPQRSLRLVRARGDLE